MKSKFDRPVLLGFVSFTAINGVKLYVRPERIHAVSVGQCRGCNIWIGSSRDEGWAIEESVDEVLKTLCDVE